MGEMEGKQILYYIKIKDRKKDNPVKYRVTREFEYGVYIINVRDFQMEFYDWDAFGNLFIIN